MNPRQIATMLLGVAGLLSSGCGKESNTNAAVATGEAATTGTTSTVAAAAPISTTTVGTTGVMAPTNAEITSPEVFATSPTATTKSYSNRPLTREEYKSDNGAKRSLDLQTGKGLMKLDVAASDISMATSSFLLEQSAAVSPSTILSNPGIPVESTTPHAVEATAANESTLPRSPMPAPVSLPAAWALWNSFVVRQDDGASVASALETGEKYDLRFDLTAGAAATVSASAADPAGKAVLARLKGKHPNLVALPIVYGDELRLLSRQPIPFTLDPSKLDTPTPQRDATETDIDFARRVAAATLTVGIRAVNEGCAVIALSLWTTNRDDLPDKPFDYVVRRLKVGKSGICQADSPTVLQSSMRAALANKSSITADAALHIFQIPSIAPLDQPQEISQAVYVDSNGKANTWRIPVDLAAYIREPNRYLANQLDQAIQFHNYATLRHRLTELIFPSQAAPAQFVTDVDVAAAQRALGSIRTLAARPGEPAPTIYAALAAADGTPQILPLGLVEVAEGEPLGRRITVVEPLRREHLGEPRCVSRWTFVLPPELVGDKGFGCAVTDVTASDVLVTDWPGFLQYFAPITLADPEGLLLLAHQGNGLVSFSDSGKPGIKPDEMKRGYAEGSVGVLVSCDASSS